jgi:septum formation protein
MPSDILEVPLPGESAPDYVLRVARDKARYAAEQVRARGLPPHPVLGADTEVVLDGEVLGKPRDAAHGKEILKRLSGRSHDVLSGVALLDTTRELTALSQSRVSFAPLSEAEIERYWASGEPTDKAGAYAVQGRAAAFITRIEGSYSGIVGLPLADVARLLAEIDYPRT